MRRIKAGGWGAEIKAAALREVYKSEQKKGTTFRDRTDWNDSRSPLGLFYVREGDSESTVGSARAGK